MLQVHITQPGETLSSGGDQRTMVTSTNLLSQDPGAFDRRPVAGSRVFTLDAGTYTFGLTVRVQSGTPTTSFGLSRGRLVATSYPLDGTGAAVPRATPNRTATPRETGSVR